MKKRIIKGFADGGRALCDEQRLEDELKNVEDVFLAIGSDRNVVKKYVEKSKQSDKEVKKQQYRGMVTIRYVQGVSEEFKRLVLKHLNFERHLKQEGR